MLPASTLTVNLLLALVFSCESVPNFVCTFVLKFGLPPIVSGSSDCRIYFKLNRNVLLTILVLTDWRTLLPFWPSAQRLYENTFNIPYKLKWIKMAEGRMLLCHGETSFAVIPLASELKEQVVGRYDVFKGRCWYWAGEPMANRKC